MVNGNEINTFLFYFFMFYRNSIKPSQTLLCRKPWAELLANKLEKILRWNKRVIAVSSCWKVELEVS